MARIDTLDDNPSGGLTPAQQTAISALLSGATVSSAAQQAGCGRRTLYRWMETPEFQAALNRGKREAWESAQATLTDLTSEALTVVRRVLSSGDGAVALRAALAVLRGRGLLDGERPAIGSDDPEELAGQRADKAAMAAMMTDLRRSMAGGK